jgi:hypothetical protein
MKQPPRVIYKGLPKSHSWARWATFRVKRRNNSTNVRFVGDTGSGKSWSALAFCEMCAKLMNKKFTEKDVYFSIREVLDEISENEPKAGTIFLIDEQQVEANAKDHQSRRARAYSLLLSTVRSNRYIIVTTLPFSDMELKSVRRFFHVEVETHGANLSTNTVRSTPRYLEYSRAKADKVYRKRLIITYTDPETGVQHNKKISFWDIPKASQELIDSYEINKANFKRKLYKRLSKELAQDEGEDKDITPKAVAADAVEGTLTDYQKAILKHMRNGTKMQKDISLKLAEEGFTSTPQKVSQNIKWMRKKGVVILR